VAKIALGDDPPLSLPPPRGGAYVHRYAKILLILDSGLTRVPYALGQEIFLLPPSTKTAEFKAKQ